MNSDWLCISISQLLFAGVVLRRLKLAGAEDRIRPTQFGFMSGVGTSTALMLIRRMMDAAWERRDGSLLVVALDWAKAFDSVSPDALAGALRRFGIPDAFVRMVQSIYSDRTLFVRDAGQESLFH